MRVSRSRGCNESFRQAVDRSYYDDEGYEIEDEEVADVVKAATSNKRKNRKLLRNFGAMFRFGSGGRGSSSKQHQHRKSTPSTPTPRPSTSSLPVSQSVPDYQSLYGKSQSGTGITGSSSEFSRCEKPGSVCL